jgi:WD40 repeat protein
MRHRCSRLPDRCNVTPASSSDRQRHIGNAVTALRRVVPLTVVVLLAACSSLGVDTPESSRGAIDPHVNSIRSAVVQAANAFGGGRALAAEVAPDGALVTVTTTGVRRVSPEAQEAQTVVDFEAGGQPTHVAFSPDGDLLALRTADLGVVRLHEVGDGEVVSSWTVPIGVDVRDLWFESVTGRLVVETSVGPVLIGTDGGVVLDGTSVPLPLGRIGELPDGKLVGASLETPELVTIFGAQLERHPVEVGDGERLEDVRVSPDGDLIAVSVSSSDDEFEQRHRVVLLDTSFAVVGSIDTDLRLDAQSWTIDDDLLVAAVETELAAWSMDGSALGRAELGTPVVALHAFDGDVVVIGQDGSIDRWDGASPPVSLDAGGTTTVFQAVDAGTGSITIVDLFGRIDVRSADGELLRSEDAFAVGELTSLAVSPDGAEVAVGSTVGTVRVLDADLAPLNDLSAADYGTRIDAVAFDPRNGGIVTGLSERVNSEAFDDTVTAWSDELTERFRALGDVADVPGCAFFNARLQFDPSGDQLVAASHDFGVSILDPVTGEMLDELPGSATVVDLAFSSDGTVLVVTHDDGVIDVWDNSERTLLATYRPSQPGVSAIAMLPAGDAMVVADLTGALSVIDVITGETVLVFDGAVARTRSIALSPDGTIVAAPTPDGTIGLWSTDSGAQLGLAPGHVGAVTALAFAPDGSRLYSASDDGTVRSWSVVSEP